jgi:hypothetical protein
MEAKKKYGDWKRLKHSQTLIHDLEEFLRTGEALVISSG